MVCVYVKQACIVAKLAVLICLLIYSNFSLVNVAKFFVCLAGGFTPCRNLRPSSGREHRVVAYSVRFRFIGG